MKQQWDKVLIKTDSGEIREGIAPMIISASRATDIPAFHAQWFMNRLKRGYLRWENRFDSGNPKYVSLQNVRLIVFWTKNPLPLMRYLDELDATGLNYYFQYTLNDYEKEGFELSVPSLSKRIKTFQKLSTRIGKERVVWRFDPLLVWMENHIQAILQEY